MCIPHDQYFSYEGEYGVWGLKESWFEGLMIIASHHTFTGQNKHLSGQIKFTLLMKISLSLLKIMNVQTIFNPYHKRWAWILCRYLKQLCHKKTKEYSLLRILYALLCGHY